MGVLLGNSGVGQLSTSQVAARLTQQYLHFSDLENSLGELLNAPRLVTEFYNSPVNPFTDQLTPAQWTDVFIKDSNYRERIIALMTALLKGGTVQGIQATAEATARATAATAAVAAAETAATTATTFATTTKTSHILQSRVDGAKGPSGQGAKVEEEVQGRPNEILATPWNL